MLVSGYHGAEVRFVPLSHVSHVRCPWQLLLLSLMSVLFLRLLGHDLSGQLELIWTWAWASGRGDKQLSFFLLVLHLHTSQGLGGPPHTA